jgi:hypothetical protein
LYRRYFNPALVAGYILRTDITMVSQPSLAVHDPSDSHDPVRIYHLDGI